MSNLNSQASAKIDASVGLLANVPQYILNKLSTNKGSDDKVEFTILYRGNLKAIKEVIDDLDGDFEDLGFNFAIVRIKVEDVAELANSDEIQYLEFPKSLYTTDFKSSRAACVPQAISTYNISGKGVLVGFIDSGIDYTHPAFLNPDGSTRIEYIYDLSASSGGKVYDKDQINEAIKSENPYSVVPEIDVTGHGTHVAGDACGGGNIPTQYKGIAQQASIAMVKGARGRWVLSSQIMRGIKFLIDKSKELNMPLVINISLSTNDGAHNGTSLLEQYIRIIANFERVTIVIAAGNEGDAGHHASGELEGTKRKSINIASDEIQLVMNIYKPILPDVSIRIIGASGDSSGDIEVREGYFQGNIGRDRYDIYVAGPKPFQLNSEIQIVISPISGEYIISGEWSIEIKTLNDYEGNFSIWLPISEGLNPQTRFLEAEQLDTLGIPATVDNIIAVGSYNPVTNTLSTFSGRGENVKRCNIRPDIVAPGEGVTGPVPEGSYDSKTGTSMATPQVSGICALFSEWGIVKGNDPYLFGQRLKYYLVKGANRLRTDIQYPNPLWGYGTVCAYDSLEILEDVINSILSERAELRQKGASNNTNAVTGGNNQSGVTGTQGSTSITSQGNNLNNIQSNTQANSSAINQNNQSGVTGAGGTASTPEDESTQYLNKPNLDDLINEVNKFTGNKAETIGLIVQYSSPNEITSINALPNTIAVPLSDAFAIVIIPIENLSRLSSYIKEVFPVYNPELYTLSALSPVESSGAPLFNDNPYLELDGTEVIVGIIDTGIDYLNEEFMLEDDTTRIIRILDQTIPSPKKEGQIPLLGTEYTEQQINQAITLQKSGGDPYSIVPSRDENGHGTMTAGIVGARGRNPDLRGAAPNCKFAIVKLKEVSDFVLDFGGVSTNTKDVYGNIEIILALNYLSQLAAKLKRPMVMYLPLGTNAGGHDGTSSVEGIFDVQSNKIGIVPVTGTGNQGDTQTHIEGRFEKTGDVNTIQIKVGKNQRNLNFEIYFAKPDKAEVEIVSPSGEVLDKVDVKIKKVVDYKFVYEGTTVSIVYLYPDQVTGDEVIIIRFRNIREGTWQFRLYGERVVDGRYAAWLPQRELLEKDTRFFNPIQQTTLTIPSTSRSVIAAAYYNQEENTIVAASGKGYTRNGMIKPDIAAGGVNALVVRPGGQTSTATGSSVASAVLAGCCALMLQWAIVNRNDPEIQFKKLQSYIIGGAKTRKGDIYPNIEWGYGMLDIQSILNSFRKKELKQKENTNFDKDIKFIKFKQIIKEKKSCEYMRKNLFYRFP